LFNGILNQYTFLNIVWINYFLEGVHLIVIGYGGYDTGIMGYLRETTSRKPIMPVS
jgi:hypothetical protein